MLAGDVEENPGPVSPQTLLEGIARLAVDAPGPVKNIILAWSPEKDVKADMDKQFKVPELREALAWVKHCDTNHNTVKSIKRKAEILDALLVAIERLLPEQCDKCEAEYTVGRESVPTIQCAGCQQGFHQECLDEMFGEADLSQFPGRLHWLCTECAPKFSLMTSVGVDGRTEKPRSKRVVREPVTEAPPVHQGPEAGDTDDDASNSADSVAAPPAPPVEPSAAGPPHCLKDSLILHFKLPGKRCFTFVSLGYGLQNHVVSLSKVLNLMFCQKLCF